MRAAWLGPLVRLAGGRPRRVLALAGALHREAQGQRRWQHAQEGGGWPGPDMGRRLTLGVLFLVSVAVAVAIGPLAGPQSWLAGIVVCGAQFGAVVLVVARDAVPLVLADEDRRLLGWWPLSERELLLARGGLLLRAVAAVTVAVGGLPVAVLAIRGAAAPWTGLGAAVGIGLHAVALSAALVVGLQSLARLLGPARARRSVELAGVVVLIALMSRIGAAAWPDSWGLPRAAPASWPLLGLPMAWFAAWAALWPPATPTLVAAGLGLVASIVLAAAGLRAAARSGAQGGAPIAVGGRRRDGSRLATAWMAPWLRGRDGRIVLHLLRAHLRTDWRLTGQLLAMPAMLLAMLWWRGGRSAVREFGDPLLQAGAADLVLLGGLLGLSFGAALTFSSEAPAAWILRQAVGDGRRLLALHRRLVRLLVVGPFLVAALGLLIARTPAVWSGLLATAIPALLAAELGVAAAQYALPAAPFSRAWRRGEQAVGRPYFWLVVLIWPLHELWSRLVLGATGSGWPVTCILLALLLLGVRWRLRRRLAARGVYGLTPLG